jgi:hypothetical protein
MSLYKDKVSASCRQDEDLSGEKFLYNKEDDIVLLFSEPDLNMAYCYKRIDLSRVVKNGYKSNGRYFQYLIVPHTNQYVVNPEQILTSTHHTFVLKPISDREAFRRDYPDILYQAEKKLDIDIFENPPDIGVEPVEEKVDIISSDEYRAREEKFQAIRREREERKREQARNEFKEYRDIPGEFASSLEREYFNNKKTYYDSISNEFVNVISPIMRRDFQRLKTEGIEQVNGIITEIEPGEDRSLTRILRGDMRGEDDVVRVVLSGNGSLWYKNGLEHRDNDLPASLNRDPEGNITFVWYKDGDKDRQDLPALLSTLNNTQTYFSEGKINRENLPAFFDDKKMSWYHDGIMGQKDNPNLPAEIWFTPCVFMGEACKGVLIFTDNYGRVILKKFVRE